MKEQNENQAIEEMAKVIDEFTEPLSARDIHKADFSERFAEHLYNAGYKKQSEGELQIVRKVHNILGDLDTELYVECPICHRTFWVPDGYGKKEIFEYASEHYPYCNCGAKMKGV